MTKLKVGVLDLVSKGPKKTLWAKYMHANMASIMPQVVATWCEQEGHDVRMVCYTGREDLQKELPQDIDLIFICAFTQAAMLAYALSNLFRSKGVVTVLGGPHARCYPDDAIKYFDYVTGFTDRFVISRILDECKPHKEQGVHLTAEKQPSSLPGVRERWKFIEPTLKKAPALKLVPMIGSMGCPYTCSFCIDSEVPYQPLSFDLLQEDLKFLMTKFKTPWVSWHDPNFGVRFNDYIDAIQAVAPKGRFRFLAESSLSILSEKHLKRFRETDFVAMLPGIESWYELGGKSKVARTAGMEKVNRVSAHINKVFEYIPYVQANFVMGLDSDEGAEPFELTKAFVDKSPGTFPGYSLLTSFGEAAPLNLEYQREDRLIAFPFSFLNNHLAMNLKPKNYEWIDFYDKVIDVTSYTFSRRAIYRRAKATPNRTSKWMNVMRAISSEGYGRIRHFKIIRKFLQTDHKFRDFFEKESTELPQYYIDVIRKDLGVFWEWLPEGAIYHDPNAYLKKVQAKETSSVS